MCGAQLLYYDILYISISLFQIDSLLKDVTEQMSGKSIRIDMADKTGLSPTTHIAGQAQGRLHCMYCISAGYK